MNSTNLMIDLEKRCITDIKDIGLNTIHPSKVVTHIPFGYKSLKICNVPHQVSKSHVTFLM